MRVAPRVCTCLCGCLCPQGVGAVGCGRPQAWAGTDRGRDWPGPCTFMIKDISCGKQTGGRAKPGRSRMESLLQTTREQGQEQEA